MVARLWFSVFVGLFLATLTRGAAPADFVESDYAFTAVGITDMEWAPDGSGRLFVSHKDGVIRIVQNGATLPNPYLTITPAPYQNSECGLVGFCFDPNYVENGYVYVFVTVSASEQQIQRYQGGDNTETNKLVLIPGLPTIGQNHDGGAIAIGPDGNLYWGIGDLGSGAGVNADLTSLAAKIGRARLDGSVPSFNPFADGPGGNQDYIFARGFRNPFKCAFQPATGLLWVNVAGSSFEQSFLVQKGDHAGYNAYENNQPAGFITPWIKYRTNGRDHWSLAGSSRLNNVATFTTSGNHGFRLGERITIEGVVDASFNDTVYVDSIPSPSIFTAEQSGPNANSGGGTATSTALGGAITGGSFYDSTAFPAEYWGNFFFCDFNSGQIIRAAFDGDNEVDRVDPFVTGINLAIDATTGPDGALYYGGFGGTIRRLAYTNTQQQLVLTPSHVNMAEGGTAVFQVSLAIAPAADVVVNVGFPTGDDSISTSEQELTFTPGNYSVPQTVSVRALGDSNGSPSRASFAISAPGIDSQQVKVNAFDAAGAVVRFTSAARGAGVATLAVAAEPRVAIALEVSANLENWQAVATNNTGPTNSAAFSDSTSLSSRFYRARAVP